MIPWSFVLFVSSHYEGLGRAAPSEGKQDPPLVQHFESVSDVLGRGSFFGGSLGKRLGWRAICQGSFSVSASPGVYRDKHKKRYQ